MDKDFEIEIQDENIEEAKSTQLPINFLALGEVEPDDVKVYIKQDVYKALEKLASSDTTKELGSIILGEYSQEYGKTHVIISQYIEAKYTDASAATLTFTHETWDYVHKEHERRYPDQKIVGWQHTHPNYGIFLSNYDMFIQENFFNLPFQVAYVIDPIQNIRGFFQWKNGRIEKLKGYYIYDDIGKPIKIEQTKVTKDKPVPAKASKTANVLIALLCAATVGLSFFTFSLYSKYNKQLEKQNEILAELSNQKEEIVSQKADILENQAAIDKQNETNEKLAAAVDELQGILKDTSSADKDGVMLINKLAEMLKNPQVVDLFTEALKEEFGNSKYTLYTVVEGDTLSSICQKHNLDYIATKNIIMSINKIDDPNQILVGQVLYLPVID